MCHYIVVSIIQTLYFKLLNKCTLLNTHLILMLILIVSCLLYLGGGGAHQCVLLQCIPIYDCMQQSRESFSVNNDRLTSGKCRFMNGTGRGVVGLVSFPGSGNTWVRGLLQAVTGICTGTGVQVKSNSP